MLIKMHSMILSALKVALKWPLYSIINGQLSKSAHIFVLWAFLWGLRNRHPKFHFWSAKLALRAEFFLMLVQTHLNKNKKKGGRLLVSFQAWAAGWKILRVSS